jgi:transcriptional regulator
MYIPPKFKQEDPEEIRQFIREYGFAILISQAGNQPWATHLPLYLDVNSRSEDILHGHVARGNRQWKDLTQNRVLAVFQGPHTYISSSWYNHENVPTWNYMAVHVYGTARLTEGEELLSSLKKLTDKYESASEKPVSVEGMSEEYVQKEIRGLVGIEIKVEEIQAVYKLSQNRDETNHQNIIRELEKRGDAPSLDIAEAMKKTKF